MACEITKQIRVIKAFPEVFWELVIADFIWSFSLIYTCSNIDGSLWTVWTPVRTLEAVFSLSVVQINDLSLAVRIVPVLESLKASMIFSTNMEALACPLLYLRSN